MFHTGFTSREAVRNLTDALEYDRAAYARFAAGMQDRGIRLIGRGLWYISAAHSEADIDQAIATATEVLKEMQV
jgi:glutamate-1-semialdehyde 2,1-aminomutase